MLIKFNDTQLVLLSAAAQRRDHCLVPPIAPKRSQAQRAVAKLLERGLVKEIRAKAGAPIWRRVEETWQTYALKLTAAGAKAIAVDETPPSEREAQRRADPTLGAADPESEPGSKPAATVSRPDGGAAPIPISPRNGTKVAEVIALLQRGDGATLAELVAATGWLPHTTRAALTGLRKRGYTRLIGPTSLEDQSIGSNGGRWPKTASPERVRACSLTRLHWIDLTAPLDSDLVRRRDDEAPKSERRRRSIGHAGVVRPRGPRRLGRELAPPRAGSA